MGQKLSVQDDFYLFRVGDVYYVKFRDPATRELLSKKSTHCRNKTLAQQWAREEWKRRCISSGLPDTLLGEYAKDFFTGDIEKDPYEKKIRAAGKRIGVKTRKDYRADLLAYILPDKICKLCVPLITRVESMDFRDRLITRFGVSRKSKRILQAYKNVIHTALDKGLTQYDSVNRLNVSYVEERRPVTVVENLKILVEPKYWKNQRIRLAVLTAAMIGLRVGEIRGIKWRDFDPVAQRIDIVRSYIDVEKEKLPKWGKVRSTVYPKSLQALLEPLRGDPDSWVFAITAKGPISYKKLRETFNQAVINAKIPKITLHSLRHSIQTALRGSGIDSELLRAAFGWSNQDVQERYTHRELYNLMPLQEATDKLFMATAEGASHG